ncbi:MAG TPA: TatD family hydrolase [Candidatus Avibacteroides avistercoris]|mgnify:CR=1 FL=1|uniref:TatD family hydrolase n=1 Tax=Candidatus Avibacteroides avistercoris TaxID=2840690 RepID=A0A9D2UII3_9BACT|nr:TatD family hydrolase [Candidatus Avibacteroides avistercoris]
MTLIDTHSHIYLPEFDEDRDAVVSRAIDAGVRTVLLPNIDASTMPALLDMVAAYPALCRPMAGLHPTSVAEGYAAELDAVRRDLDNVGGLVAVGEIGLDLYWDTTYRRQQMEAFDAQLDMAAEHDLPVVIHCRNAFDDMMDILENHLRVHDIRGVAHSFTGTVCQAERLMSDTNLYVGVNGIVTFKKSDLPQVLRHIPIDRVVPETDAPYLAPVPHRGRRNESAFVVDVVRKIAEVYGLDFDKTAAVMEANARKLFEL